jgi:hypothetical protein
MMPEVTSSPPKKKIDFYVILLGIVIAVVILMVPVAGTKKEVSAPAASPAPTTMVVGTTVAPASNTVVIPETPKVDVVSAPSASVDWLTRVAASEDLATDLNQLRQTQTYLEDLQTNTKLALQAIQLIKSNIEAHTAAR